MNKFIVAAALLVLSLVLFSAIIPAVSADGMINIYDYDRWNLFSEKAQFCAINYKEGVQNMILTVDTGEQLAGQKAVWIFPVPAAPDQTAINIVKGFPEVNGIDVKTRADDSIFGVFTSLQATQVYTIFPAFFFLLSGSGSSLGSGLKGAENGALQPIDGVTVHQSIEKMGLTTELVSAEDGSAMEAYLISKGLNITDSSKSMLDGYAGQKYSFVITWISNVSAFNQAEGQIGSDQALLGRYLISVFISFPTDRIFYPLKPTSVYGETRVPAVIYVLDYVEPELSPELVPYANIAYYWQSSLGAPDSMKEFYRGYKTEPVSYAYYYEGEENTTGFTIQELEYTKIKIDAPSKDLAQDLWMVKSTPQKVKNEQFAYTYSPLFGFAFFIICSCLASLFSGLIIFRDRKISVYKFMLFGFVNFSSFIGFSIISYLAKVDISFTDSKEIQEKKAFFKKVLLRTLLIASIIPILLSLALFILFVTHIGDVYWSEVVPMMLMAMFALLFLFGMMILLIGPIVWGYYNNRKIMKFIILFTVLFLALSAIFEALLIMMI